MSSRLLFLIALATLFITTPARAETAYTDADAAILQQCVEAVRDILDDPEADGQTGYQECIGKASEACQLESDENSTTIGMAECAARETAWWDEQLNSHYAALRDILDDEEFAHLREAQRAWIAYKDAKCAFEHFYWREGTIRTIIGSSCVLQTTAERSIDLMGVLDWTDN